MQRPAAAPEMDAGGAAGYNEWIAGRSRQYAYTDNTRSSQNHTDARQRTDDGERRRLWRAAGGPRARRPKGAEDSPSVRIKGRDGTAARCNGSQPTIDSRHIAASTGTDEPWARLTGHSEEPTRTAELAWGAPADPWVG